MALLESSLLKDLKRSDHTAFEALFDRYSAQLFRFSLSYLKSKEAAEDVVQEVFIKIWKNRKALKTDTSFQSYLFTIALNSVRKYFNQQAKLYELKHGIIVDLSDKQLELDDCSDYQILLDKLDEVIKRMPEKRQVVFIKKKIEGKSLNEISEELNISIKTVEYHITEAMKFLKQEFNALQIKGLIFYHLFVS